MKTTEGPFAAPTRATRDRLDLSAFLNSFDDITDRAFSRFW